MTDKRTQDTADQGNMKKNPDDWVTGEEPMTGAQRSYLKTLSEEAKQPFDESLTRRMHRDASRNCRHAPAAAPLGTGRCRRMRRLDAAVRRPGAATRGSSPPIGLQGGAVMPGLSSIAYVKQFVLVIAVGPG